VSERRLITAHFADVSGFTALADRLDPEQLTEVIDPVISTVSSIVGRYDDYVGKFAGDALLACSAPRSATRTMPTGRCSSRSGCTTSWPVCAKSSR
jgi:class 3 adenylate cyclase